MKRLIGLLLALAVSLPLAPQSSEPDTERAQRLKWWTEARFGMFIHWGIYTVPAGEWQGQPVKGLGEWIMNRARIPVHDYEKLASQFDPVKFNADDWVAIAKNAGIKYITITAKHHDGFAMYGSKVSRYNIVDATAFHRDPLKDLAVACRRQGIRLCFYYSQTQDWHEADAVGNDWDFPDTGKKNFQRYYDQKVIPQVRELLTNYGPVGLIWFDTPRNITLEQSQELADLVHQLQPMCLVSGRVGHDLGDYVSAGDNQISVGSVRRPWETPVTMNDTWGFKKDDHNWKSAQVLIRQLATTASRGGNYLLNIGPTSEGVIPPETVERLAHIGAWTRANGESIYATAASPFPYTLPWGVMTARPGRIYLHVFNWPHKELILYGLKSRVDRAYLLTNGKTLAVKQSQDPGRDLTSVRLTLPAEAPDQNDTVIALAIAGEPQVDPVLQQQPDGTMTLHAYLGDLTNAGDSEARFDSRGVVERWTDHRPSIHWAFKAHEPGSYEVELITSEQKYGNGWDGGQRITAQVGAQTVRGVVSNNGREENPSNPYWPYIVSKIGRVHVGKAGQYSASIKVDEVLPGQKYGLTLVALRLVPVQ